MAWLLLEVVFFGFGSLTLAIVAGRPGPAMFVAGAILAFGLGVTASDRLARRRAPDEPEPGDPKTEQPTPIRPVVVAAMTVLGVAVLVPTLVAVGIPALVGDVTAARSEIGGLEL